MPNQTQDPNALAAQQPNQTQDPNALAAQQALVALNPRQQFVQDMDVKADEAEQAKRDAAAYKTVPTGPDMSTGGELAHLAGQAGEALLLGPFAPAYEAGKAVYQHAPGFVAGGLRGLGGMTSDPQTKDLLNKGADALSPQAQPTPTEAAPATDSQTISITRPAPPHTQVDTQVGGHAAPAPQMDMMDPARIDADTNAQVKAAQAQAALNAKIAGEQAPLKQALGQQAAADVKVMEQRSNDSYAQQQEAIQKAKAFTEQSVDVAKGPGFWGSLDTGKKILTGIGVALSSLVSAASRGRVPNIGLELFENAIADDTRRQFARANALGQAANGERDLATLAKNTFDSLPVQYASVFKAKMDATAQETEAIAARYGSEAALDAGKRLAAELRLSGDKQLMEAYKANNLARVQASDVAKNRAAEARVNALLPGELKLQQGQLNTGLVRDADGNTTQMTPEAGDRIRAQQAALASRSIALRNIQKLADTGSLTDKDELRIRLANSGLDKDRVAQVLQNLPDRFSPADVGPIIKGLLSDTQTEYGQLGKQ